MCLADFFINSVALSLSLVLCLSVCLCLCLSPFRLLDRIQIRQNMSSFLPEEKRKKVTPPALPHLRLSFLPLRCCAAQQTAANLKLIQAALGRWGFGYQGSSIWRTESLLYSQVLGCW